MIFFFFFFGGGGGGSKLIKYKNHNICISVKIACLSQTETLRFIQVNMKL